MNILELIEDFCIMRNNSDESRTVVKKRLLQIYKLNNEFIDLNTVEMHNLLINELKVTTGTIVTIQNTMKLFYDYLISRNIVNVNIFNTFPLSVQTLMQAAAANIYIISEADFESLLDSIEYNKFYIESIYRLAFECVCYTAKEIANIKRDMTNHNKGTIHFPDRIIPISERLLYCLEEVKFQSVWTYYNGAKKKDLLTHDDSLLFKYGTRSEELEINNLNIGKLEKFISFNCFNKEFNGMKFNTHYLYICGLIHKIVKNYGGDYLFKYFLDDVQYKEIHKVIDSFKLNFDVKRLSILLKPYVFAYKNST